MKSKKSPKIRLDPRAVIGVEIKVIWTLMAHKSWNLV